MISTTGNKLNRSCSESDLNKVNFDDLTIQDYSSIGFEKKTPFMRKRVLIVEEIIHGSSPQSLRSRSSSCGQIIPDHFHNLQSFFSTSLVLNNPFDECDVPSFNRDTQLKPNIPKVEASSHMKDVGVIPMEVDFSSNSLKFDDCDEFVETMDIDSDSFTRGRFSNLDGAALKNRYYNQKQPEKNIYQSIAATNKTEIVPIISQKKQTQYNNFVLIGSVCFVLILLYILLIQGHINVMSGNSDIQLKNIQKDLLERVHKQKTSVNVVMQSLERRDHWKSKIKVLGFIGPTGVGKTLIANIIKKHFHQGLIHELYGIQLSYKSQWENVITTLNNCCFNLIIIDDLMKKDLTDLFALIHSLPQDQYILVISIFNIQYYDGSDHIVSSNDITEIRNEFDNSGLCHELVVFQQFDIDEVKYWLKEQLKLKNVDSNIQEEILTKVLEGHVVQNQGLKGLYSKILLELEKYKH